MIGEFGLSGIPTDVEGCGRAGQYGIRVNDRGELASVGFLPI